MTYSRPMRIEGTIIHEDGTAAQFYLEADGNWTTNCLSIEQLNMNTPLMEAMGCHLTEFLFEDQND